MEMTKDQLAAEVEWRSKHVKGLRSEIDSYAERNFGINEFSSKADGFLGHKGGLSICLARQVPTTNIEQAALEVVCSALDAELGFPVRAHSLSFVRDSYSGKNEYKKSLICQPILGRRKRGERVGELFIQNKNLIPKGAGNLEGHIFSEILTSCNRKLPDFHKDERRQAFGNFCQTDLSAFLEECLRESLAAGKCQRRIPEHVYAEHGGKTCKIQPSMVNGYRIRPPAEWFYHVYFLLLVDGRRALASTINDCEMISRIIGNSIRDIKREIGVEPLIIDTPDSVEVDGFRSDLIEINPNVFSVGWREQVDVPGTDNIFSLFAEVEKGIIQVQ